MKYFTFQSQFHQPILDGVKRSTIRPSAKLKAGEVFALRYWIGSPYRSKMGILGTATCVEVSEFIVGPSGMCIGPTLVQDESALADQEGFRSSQDMRRWFYDNHGPEFVGFIHVWSRFCGVSA